MDRKPTLYRVKTHDGVRIAVWRYPAKGERKTPAFLVHGLGSNRFDMDYPGRYSIAQHLRAGGFDTWILELRGAGASRQTLKKLTRRWCLDDYLIHDIPAAFRLVEQETGTPGVHWVGHSLGGMLAYPVLATADRRRIRSCVTLGAPSMTKLASGLFDLGRPLEPLIRWAPPVLPGYKVALALGSPIAGLIAPIVGKLFFNAENIDTDAIKVMARWGIDDVPTGVMAQFFEWYRTKKFTTHYGTVDVMENLDRATAPLLVVAGGKDDLTPLADVREPYDRAGSPVKELLIAGKAQGFCADYGHVDLVFGRRAPDEIFPRIRDWFARHDDPSSATTPLVVSQGKTPANGGAVHGSDPAKARS